jgi:hypothetical protein
MSRKLEEKQRRRQAEEQRKQAQRRAARRRNLFTYGIVAVVAVVVVSLIVAERTRETGPVGVGSERADCAQVQTFPIEGRQHVSDGTDIQYQSSPPTSGNHYEVPATSGFAEPSTLGQIPEERYVHNLEHGQIVIWYSTDAPDNVIDDLEAYIDGTTQPQAMLAVPYEGLDDSFGLTAWGASRTCEAVSEDVIDSFRARFQGKAPEPLTPPFET